MVLKVFFVFTIGEPIRFLQSYALSKYPVLAIYVLKVFALGF